MIARVVARRVFAVGCCVVLTATGCAFHGLNSLPLPGAVGRGPGANIYHVELPNVGTMESNSPVMIDDVVVGSVGTMRVQGWHADVEISVKRDVVVPANVVATVGQTSLLGSMHVELNTPLGQQGSGRLQPGATIPLSRSSAYPSTEQTLSSLGAVVNGGGLGQIGEVIHNFSAALSGHEGAVRDLITRLDTFVGTLDDQRDNIVASIQALNRLAGHLRRPTRRSHRGAAQDTAGARGVDQGAAASDGRPGPSSRVQQHRHPAGQRRPGRPGQEPQKPGADHQGARRRRTGVRRGDRGVRSCSRSPRTSSTERSEATSSTCISIST